MAGPDVVPDLDLTRNLPRKGDDDATDEVERHLDQQVRNIRWWGVQLGHLTSVVPGSANRRVSWHVLRLPVDKSSVSGDWDLWRSASGSRASF